MGRRREKKMKIYGIEKVEKDLADKAKGGYSEFLASWGLSTGPDEVGPNHQEPDGETGRPDYRIVGA